MFRFFKFFLIVVVSFTAGAYLFSSTQARKFITLTDCKPGCVFVNELLGLLASVGIQKLPHPESAIVLETDKTVVVEHPYSEAPIHLLIIPKRDIKNIGQVSIDDQAYIMDAFAVIKKLVDDRGLKDYQVITNGPGLQQVDYLHFHLMAWPEGSKKEKVESSS